MSGADDIIAALRADLAIECKAFEEMREQRDSLYDEAKRAQAHGEKFAELYSAEHVKCAALEAAHRETIECDNENLLAQQTRIAALEAALEKADALIETLLDDTCYPLDYRGKLRQTVCDYQAARAKVKP